MSMLWIVLIILLIAVAVVLYRHTKAKGPLGIDLSPKTCPRCGQSLPVIRKPASEEERMFGGWTCQNCGTKVDKYGRERGAS
jgi:transposase-like protein